ncbi:Os08g0201900 [Oryza sativa Japonica Group]|uniref:Os08g0201900 protein n=1 Tax=Oryza sativa subsp. japonica TaxID=39947 RepID=C7J5U6_ORYSJ|nr:Os08g0201900 [Oryza sativa Japonica Group]|eukprot:NP_001175430.1 Os08g0201900 [Oryza sativa Japonica Group]
MSVPHSPRPAAAKCHCQHEACHRWRSLVIGVWERTGRMQSYIMAEDYDIWRKVSHAYVIPEVINTAAEKTAFEQNCKARNFLLSGISHSDYDHVAHLETAHEIWNALKNFHQGTNNIKELRRDLFKKEYIKFEMKSGEALDDYLSRFNKILSDLRSVDSSYDANYPQSEISRHFLNGLDMSIWEMKVTSIQESVNMSTLTLDSLYTKLKTHEMNVLSRKVDSKSSALVSSSSSLVVDASSSMPSFLAAFNATSDDQLEQIEDEDLALVANRIARAMNNARNRKRGGPNRCFECGSIDHLRSHCPKLGRGKREDKDGEKTNNNKPNNYNDVDGESGDDDKGKKVSDVCFMARGESDTEYEDNEYWIPKFLLSSNPSTEASTSACVSTLVARKENVWIVDSGCSRHMTGDKNWFSSLKKASKTESIVFADASTSAVVATCLVKVNEKFELKNVALVKDLKYNLLSVSQIVDEEFEVHFKKTGSKVFYSRGDSVLNISRYGIVFKAGFENSVSPVITCLVAKFDKAVMFWHRRLGHVGFDHLTRLSGLDLVRGLPKLKKDLDLVCTPCRHAKMVSTSHAPIVSVMTDAPGQLLHMDTVGPVRVKSVGGKWYVLVIVDDFSRYSWVFFMATKDEAFQHFRENSTSTSTETELGSTSEVAAPLHIQRRHPPEQIIGNIVDFAETMRREFEMSMMGELSYFLGLQIKQTPQGTFVHQTKYTNDLLRRFKMENYKPISTPIGSTAVLDPDEDGEAVDQKDVSSCFTSSSGQANNEVTRCLGRVFAVMDRESAWG